MPIDNVRDLERAVGRAFAERWRELSIENLREAGDRLDWHVEPVIESFTEVYEEDGDWIFRIEHQSAGFLEWGTSPHTIEPDDPDGVLVFEVDGETVFTKEVEHPGTPPILYVTNGRNRLVVRGLD